MASTLQLEFAQAMSDFKTMFPDMERDVIEAVLRANQGAVDATIDQLLAMSTDNQVCNVTDNVPLNAIALRQLLLQNEKLRDELDQGGESATPNTSATNRTVATFDLIEPLKDAPSGTPPKPSDAQGSSLAAANKRRWNPPMLLPLPPNFLRLSSNEVAPFALSFFTEQR